MSDIKIYARPFNPVRALAIAAVLCLQLFALSYTARSQSLSFNRERGYAMLGEIKNDLKKNYYNPALRGMDVAARFNQAKEEIKQATSLGQITAAIAQALLDLNDSHTFFLPPAQATRVEYGWVMQMRPSFRSAPLPSGRKSPAHNRSRNPESILRRKT
jgi:hypothetical protein